MKKTVPMGIAVGTIGICAVSSIILCVAVSSRSPRITFSGELYYDWGVVDEGQTIRHEFPFTNEGRTPLEILKVKPGCSCAKAEVTRTTVLPGEDAAIVITYSGRNVFTRERANVILETNDPQKRFVQVLLTGFVRVNVFCSPTSVSFYSLSAVPSEPRIIRMSSHSSSLHIKQVSASTDAIIASAITDEKGLGITVSLKPNCPPCNLKETVRATVEFEGQERQVTIPVYVMVGRTG